jgi:hypothetical protein
MLKFSGLMSLVVFCLASVESFGQGPVAVLCGELGGNWNCANSYPGGPFGASCQEKGTCNADGKCNDWVIYQEVGNQNQNYQGATFDEATSGHRELGSTLVVCQWELFCSWDCIVVDGGKKCTNSGYAFPWIGFDYDDLGPCP